MATIRYSENISVIDGSAVTGTSKAIVFAGSDGTYLHFVKTLSDGTILTSTNITNPTTSVTAYKGGTWAIDSISTSVTVNGNVSVGNFPTSFGATQSTSPWVVSVTNQITSVTSYQGGAWTVAATQSGQFNVSTLSTILGTVTVQGSSLSVTQAGSWTIDSVGTSVAVHGTVAVTGSPTSVTAFQGTNPWVISGAPTSVTSYQGTSPWIIGGAVSQSGSWTVGITGAPTSVTAYQGTSPWVNTITSGTVSVIQSGTWNVNNISTISSIQGGTVSSIQSGTWNVNNVSTVSSIQSGTVSVIQSGTWSMPTVAESTTISYNSAVSAVAVQIKATAASLSKLIAENANTSAVYLQCFNKTAASVTVGVTSPDDVIPLPAGNSASDPMVAEINFPKVNYSAALSIAISNSRTAASSPAITVPITIYYI